MGSALRGVLCLSICVALAGCGEREGEITGTVTFDGQPVPNGSITFVNPDTGARGGGVIRDGSFQTKLQPGKYQVAVTAARKAGKKTQKGFDGKDETIELTEELIPEWYNTKTELIEEIKPGGNSLKFDLKSKK